MRHTYEIIGCIGGARARLEHVSPCELDRLQDLRTMMRGEALVPLLPRVMQVVVTRLRGADLFVRGACAETVGRLAGCLVVDGPEGPPVLAVVLCPSSKSSMSMTRFCSSVLLVASAL
jgi:hypothetical protein